MAGAAAAPRREAVGAAAAVGAGPGAEAAAAAVGARVGPRLAARRPTAAAGVKVRSRGEGGIAASESAIVSRSRTCMRTRMRQQSPPSVSASSPCICASAEGLQSSAAEVFRCTAQRDTPL